MQYVVHILETLDWEIDTVLQCLPYNEESNINFQSLDFLRKKRFSNTFRPTMSIFTKTDIFTLYALQ